MVRRIVGIALILVGAFGVALAILLPAAVVPASKKTPLDLDITQVSTGPTRLLDAATGQLKQVNLRATRVVRTDSHASDATNTTINETLCIVVVQGNTPDCVASSDPRLLSVTTDRVTADRKSAESVHVGKYSENVNGDTSVRHTGLSYKWPIDAKKKTYQFYQPDVRKAFPARYVGTDKVNGLDVYKYTSTTGKQPYKIQGAVDGSYDDTRTVWVEPGTGTIVKGIERQVQTLANGQTALDTTLTFDKKAVDFQTKFAQGKLDDLKKAQVWLPVIAGVVGVVALVFGLILLRGRRRAPGTGDGGGGTPPPGQGPPPPAGPNYDDSQFRPPTDTPLGAPPAGQGPTGPIPTGPSYSGSSHT